MDLFDTCLDFSDRIPRMPHQDLARECKAPNSSFSQKSLILNILQRKIVTSSPIEKEPKDPLYMSGFDKNLAEHIKKHQGWGKEAQESWKGSLQTASRRLNSLQKRGLLDQNLKPTAQLDIALVKHKERAKQRTTLRATLVRQERIKSCQKIVEKFTPEQKNLFATLAEFRQISLHQSKLDSNQLKQLKDQGLVETKRVMLDQKTHTLLTLSERKKGISGKDAAHYGLGIEKPFAGIQRDESKLLHDISVIDSIEHAKAKFIGKGYQFIGAVSEHRLYGEKTSPTSDQGQKYADAYLLFKDSGGETCNIAIEFGNYPPGYLKEKVAGIDTDHILVYTHDEAKAQQYMDCILDPRIEIHVIHPPQSQEIDR